MSMARTADFHSHTYLPPVSLLILLCRSGPVGRSSQRAALQRRFSECDYESAYAPASNAGRITLFNPDLSVSL
jgi:hypothetical protein